VTEIHAEAFDRTSALSWSEIGSRVAEIEREVFGEDAFSAEELRGSFLRARSVAALLVEGRDFVVGYTYAAPARARATYYISNTAIAKSYQGRGLVKLLMERLYARIRAAGARFIERDVAIANGYADMLARVHAAEILETFDHESEYGPQRFIRMRVPEP